MEYEYEPKDSPVSEETADAERQTKDARCGSRVGDWWMASVASMATVETVVSMASLAPVASMAPMASMVEALDWLKRVTAESKSDDDDTDCLDYYDDGGVERRRSLQ